MKLKNICLVIVLNVASQVNVEAMQKTDFKIFRKMAANFTADQIKKLKEEAIFTADQIKKLKEEAILEGMQETGLSRQGVLDLFEKENPFSDSYTLHKHSSKGKVCLCCELGDMIDEINAQMEKNKKLIREAQVFSRHAKFLELEIEASIKETENLLKSNQSSPGLKTTQLPSSTKTRKKSKPN